MSFLDGQEFSILQPAGVKVVAFVVNRTEPEKWSTLPLYLLEKLEYTQKEVDGKITKTFSIPAEDETFNVIVLSLAKNRCVIGHGMVKDNQFIAEKDTIHLQYTNMADVSGEEKEFSFKYNPKRQIVIVDVEKGEQVLPKISRNEVTQGFDGKYKLIPYKNYVALELAVKFDHPGFKNQKTNPSMEELANMKI